MTTYTLPSRGASWAGIKGRLAELQSLDWSHRDGRLPLHCYYANDDVSQVAAEAYAMFASTNALAPVAFPSTRQMEQEVVAMALGLLHGPSGSAGCMTSGGTESIILAVKAARDFAAATRPRKQPNIVLPRSVHPAFDKAAHLLGLTVRRTALQPGYRCDVAALEAAMDEDTILLVASAPSLPYGLVDPIAEVGQLALRTGTWLHVDSCIGGMLAPFVAKLGYPVPPFDFAVPGVRSMSADLHKFGYSAKGASLVLYRDEADLDYQYCRFDAWPKGDYFTPTLAGTRSGGTIASAWAVMHFLGEEGYLATTARLMRLRDHYIAGFRALGLEVLGPPDLAVVTVTAPQANIFTIADDMRERGWYMSLVAEPPAIQQTVNLVHEQVAERYFDDLAAAVQQGAARAAAGIEAHDARAVVTY